MTEPEYDTLSIVLNSSNVSSINNTTLTYNFLNGGIDIPPDSEICCASATIPYAFFNINSSIYNNSTFSYNWYSASGVYTTYNVVLKNGNYSTADINTFLQQYMIQNNQYLIDSGGNYIYFISIQTNINSYANQIICSPVPASLPTGYTAPTGFVFNSNASTPVVNILSNNFQTILGFSAGSYPSVTSTTQTSNLSNITPNNSPVNSIVLLSSLVNNPCISPPTILDSFSFKNTSFGSNIVYAPSFEKWIRVNAGKYTNFQLSLTDQNFNAIYSNDPNLLINILLRLKRRK